MMVSYYARIPAAGQRREIDGNLYGLTNLQFDGRGPVMVRETAEAHMYRVAFVTNGEAYLLLGRAGDAIAQRVNLPFGCSWFES